MEPAIYEDEKYLVNFNQGHIYRKFKLFYRRIGFVNENGYCVTWINNKLIIAHRFIMSKFIGRPLRKDECIDHIDHNRNNNAISNLRIVSKRQNQQHLQGASCNSQSRVLGVYFDKNTKKGKPWRYSISRFMSGRYKTMDEAIKARNEHVSRLNAQGNMYSYSSKPIWLNDD